MKNVCIAGDGGWGTTLAVLLSKKGCGVSLWGAFPDYVEILKSRRENIKFLPGVNIPKEITITSDFKEAARGKDFLVLAVPAQFMRSVLERLKAAGLPGVPAISVTKGIENGTLKRMSEVMREFTGQGAPLGVLTGPTIALEVANGVPTTAVASSTDPALARDIRDLFMTERFRIYTNDDMTGVELGGALKNIIAIAAGALDGLGYGTNAKAALLTRGLVEITRLGLAMGARRETFYGLSGLGDLTTTCVSQYSRNRWLGEEIGKGKKLDAILKETDMVVEGVATSKSAYDLSKRHKVEMPIAQEIYRVLYEKKDPKSAVHDLMTRSPKSEEEY